MMAAVFLAPVPIAQLFAPVTSIPNHPNDDGRGFLAPRAVAKVILSQSRCRRFRKRLEFWSMTTMPLSDVKARLSEIAEEVDRTHERIHVTRNGREYVVLLSAEDLESLEATIELLRDNSAMSRVREAEAAATADDLTTAEEMAKLMAERRVREPRER